MNNFLGDGRPLSNMETWLQSQYQPSTPSEPWLYTNRQVTVLERMAFLIYAKGKTRGVQWGSLAFGEGPWGRTGLSQNEALELIYLYGVRDGIILSDGDHYLTDFNHHVQAETKRVIDEQGFSEDLDVLTDLPEYE